MLNNKHSSPSSELRLPAIREVWLVISVEQKPRKNVKKREVL